MDILEDAHITGLITWTCKCWAYHVPIYFTPWESYQMIWRDVI